MRRSYLHRGNQASERGFSSKEARALKRAKFYDNVDPYSMNNEFTDPDFDRYEVKTPDNFGEDPDMDTDWRRDVEKGFDEESNFMLPLEQASPYNLSPKMAAHKASACIKIAQQMFPDGTDEFIDVQAADLMHLPSQVVASTLVRMSQYNTEPERVAEQGKQAAVEQAPVVATVQKKAEDEEAKDEAPAEEMKAPAEEAAPADVEGQVEEMQTAVEDLQKELEEIQEEYSEDMSDELAGDLEEMASDVDELSDMVEEFDVDDLDSELEAMDAEMAPDGEMDIDFDEEDGADMGLDGEEIDAKLASAFLDDESTISFDRMVSKSAKNKAASKKSNNENLKLSKLMGNKVAKRSNAKDLLVESLWDSDPVVEDAFSY